MVLKKCISAFLFVLSSVIPLSGNTVRQAFYKARMNDVAVAPEKRVAFMDSLLMLAPDDYGTRMAKSDLCYRMGLYDEAAREYMMLAGRFGDKIGDFNRLRAAKMAAQALSMGGHGVEAARMALGIIRQPKPDSLGYYDLTARDVMINAAMMASDYATAQRYLDQQQDEIDRLSRRSMLRADIERQHRFVWHFNKLSLLNATGRFSDAIAEADIARKYASSYRDTMDVEMNTAEAFSNMGEKEMALDIYRRNLGADVLVYNNRSAANSYARLLLDRGKQDDALKILSDYADPAMDNITAENAYLTARAIMMKGDYRRACALLVEAYNLADSLAGAPDAMSASLREFEVCEAEDRADTWSARSARWRVAAIVFALIAVAAIAGAVLYTRRSRKGVIMLPATGHDVDDSETRRLITGSLEMTQLAETLESVAQIAREAPRDALERIQREISSLNYSKGVWETFKTSFESLHPGFFAGLTRECPGMSIGEMRMAAYIVLGLTNKEIATIINRQPRTVDTIKYRLRKSLAIPSDITTADYLRRFLPST